MATWNDAVLLFRLPLNLPRPTRYAIRNDKAPSVCIAWPGLVCYIMPEQHQVCVYYGDLPQEVLTFTKGLARLTGLLLTNAFI